ncbi:MAG: hypothetical protein JWQ71_5034 [Pedosphaera sp.]|nr:hypothetical protein [Pedosphaera sp.]
MDFKRSGSKERVSKIHGFTLVELLLIIVIVVVGVGFLLPALWRSKVKVRRDQCINNLKQAGICFRIWNSGSSGDFPMQYSTNQEGSKEYILGGNAFRHFQCLSNELADAKVLFCPTDLRTRATNFTSLQNSNVSYFVAVDADETVPSMLLAGDRNLMTNGIAVDTGLAAVKTNYVMDWTEKMHNGQGNILFADGHVGQLDNMQLQEALIHTGTNMNRLAIP